MSLALAAAPDSEAVLVELGQKLLAFPAGQLEQFLGRLDPSDLGIAERAIAAAGAIGWRAHPAAMASHLTAGRFRRRRYIDYLSNKFVDAVEGRSTRQIWNLPSRFGKSEVIQWGCVWVLDKTNGRARMILVSYGYELAAINAVNIRDRLIEHEDSLRGQLRPDRRRHDRFVTDAGGGVMAAGINGAIRGFGAADGGGIVVDDPFKNWQDAHSETRRNHVENQYKGTIRDRLDDENCWIIIVMQRVHEDDLTHRLRQAQEMGEGDDWELVSLPALALENDLLGRAVGEPLDNEHFPLEAIQARMKSLGAYLASATMQQNPTPEEGSELLRAWFGLAQEAELPRRPERAISSWDLKLKDREAGDYVVGQVWWAVSHARWCMDQLRGQYDHATTANAVALLAVRHPEVKRHIIEAAGSSDEVIPQLRRPEPGYEVSDEMASRLGMTDDERALVARVRRGGMGNLVAVPATDGSKAVRARNYIARTAEAGNLRLPADAPWVAAYLDEMAAFPNGLHDDQVDASSQALRHLAARSGIRASTAADSRLP